MSVFEGACFGMQLQVIAQVATHELEGVENCNSHTIDKTITIGHDVHLIHVTKRRIGVCTATMAERGGG